MHFLDPLAFQLQLLDPSTLGEDQKRVFVTAHLDKLDLPCSHPSPIRTTHSEPSKLTLFELDRVPKLLLSGRRPRVSDERGVLERLLLVLSFDESEDVGEDLGRKVSDGSHSSWIGKRGCRLGEMSFERRR